MPATQGYRLEDWHEPPLTPPIHLEPDVDNRVFDIHSVEEVAACLLETDDVIETYRWLLSEAELGELALESAKGIIKRRILLREERMLQQEFEKAKQARNAANRRTGKRMAAIAIQAQDLRTGETRYANHVVPMTRAFG